MKQQSKITLAIFLAGFFAKDVIDDIFFVVSDYPPIEIFGFTITKTLHKLMLVVSTLLTVGFLYYGLSKSNRYMQNE